MNTTQTCPWMKPCYAASLREPSQQKEVDISNRVNDSSKDKSGIESGKSLSKDFVLQRLGTAVMVGRGTYGTVYAIDDQDLEGMIAVKVLKGVSTTEENYQNEVEAMTKVPPSPFVVKLLTNFKINIGHNATDYFIVMEYFQGRNLFEEMWEIPFSPHAIQFIALQLHLGLQHIHSMGIIHRDIRPVNILINRNTGHVKITDFGCAMVGTEGRGCVGTWAYMAPEVLAHHADFHAPPYGCSVDIYSMGATMFYLFYKITLFDYLKTYPIMWSADFMRVGFLYPWRISEFTMHFLGRVLHPDPRQRATHEEIARHGYLNQEQIPWF